MRYLLTIYSDESKMPAPGPGDEDAYSMSPAFAAYNDALKKAGAWHGGDRLRPTATATTLRVANGKTELLNGPYAETKEQLGGYYVIEAPDLDAALKWAERCPAAAHGAIEVRPIWDAR